MQFTTLTLAALSVVGAFAESSSSAEGKGSAKATGAAGVAKASGVAVASGKGSATGAGSAKASGTASGGVTVHVVRVGGPNGTLAFSPNDIKAAAGDMIQFQFAPNNHSVVQSTFDAPCQASGSSIFSGYMPVAASAMTTPTYTIMVNDTKPLWFYCSQGKHCQNGMSMVVNVAATGNKTLAAYQAAAKSVTQATIPGQAGGAGTATNGTANTGSGSGTGSGSSGTGSGSGTGTGTGTGSSNGGASAPGSSASSTPTTSTTSSGSFIKASSTLVLGAMVAAFFL